MKVIHRLSRHGHVAYLVGGCVRDLLLDFLPKDFDIATSAVPDEIRGLFRNCRIIGRRFRLAHILFSGKFIEVSTFRGNVSQPQPPAGSDLLIRDDNVFGNPEEDALRRDFTLNALFYDVETDEVIDYVGGLKDIEKRLLRCIGDPQIRFREDPIRILRALRFGARLGFECEADVHQAIADVRSDLVRSAPPRIHEELLKTLGSGAAAKALEEAYGTGVLAALAPAISDRVLDVGDRLFPLLKELDRIDGGRRQLSDAVLLGFLLYPLYEESSSAQAAPQEWLDELRFESPLLQSTKRRDVDQIIQMFRAQRRFMGQSRSRRFSISSFIRRDYFQDSWLLFQSWHRVTGQFGDEVDEWRQRVETTDFIEPQQGEGGQASRDDVRRRHQDGRRRRRRRGPSSDSASNADKGRPDPE